MDTPDPSQLRISDQDRHQVAEVLREAAGEGRIDLEELDQRLDATFAARTYADLVPITLDLPAAPATHVPDPTGRGHAVAGGARTGGGATPRDPRRPRAQGRLGRAAAPRGDGVHGWRRPRPAPGAVRGARGDDHGQRRHGRRRHQGQPPHPRDHGGRRDPGRLLRPVRRRPGGARREQPGPADQGLRDHGRRQREPQACAGCPAQAQHAAPTSWRPPARRASRRRPAPGPRPRSRCRSGPCRRSTCRG